MSSGMPPSSKTSQSKTIFVSNTRMGAAFGVVVRVVVVVVVVISVVRVATAVTGNKVISQPVGWVGKAVQVA